MHPTLKLVKLFLVLLFFALLMVNCRDSNQNGLEIQTQPLVKRGVSASKVKEKPPLSPREQKRRNELRNVHHPGYGSSSESSSGSSSRSRASSGYSTPSGDEDTELSARLKTSQSNKAQNGNTWTHGGKVYVPESGLFSKEVTLKKPLKTTDTAKEHNLQLWQGSYEDHNDKQHKIKVLHQTNNGLAQQYVGTTPVTKYHDPNDPHSPHGHDRIPMAREQKVDSNNLKTKMDNEARKEYVQTQKANRASSRRRRN